MKKLLWVLAAVLVILAGTGIYYGNNGLFAPAVTKDVAIPKGAGTGEIARLLKENVISKSELAFKHVAYTHLAAEKQQCALAVCAERF